MDNQVDEKLWRIAKKRADFKRHLTTYVLVNGFLWLIWWFTIGRHNFNAGLPWPVWPMLGWGLGLGFQYANAYSGSADKHNAIEQEYEKLKRQQQP